MDMDIRVVTTLDQTGSTHLPCLLWGGHIRSLCEVIKAYLSVRSALPFTPFGEGPGIQLIRQNDYSVLIRACEETEFRASVRDASQALTEIRSNKLQVICRAGVVTRVSLEDNAGQWKRVFELLGDSFSPLQAQAHRSGRVIS